MKKNYFLKVAKSPLASEEEAEKLFRDTMNMLDRLTGNKEGSTYRAMKVKEVE